MISGKVFRTTTFRLALGYLLLFCLSVMAVLGFVYWTTSRFMAQQTDETIAAEVTGLAEQYRRGGIDALSQTVAERSRNQRYSLYLLSAGSELRIVAGNLDAWPIVPDPPNRWVDFWYERPVGGEVDVNAARGRVIGIVGGLRLLVARDVAERVNVAGLLRDALLWSLGLTIVLGLAGGVLMGRSLLRRVDEIAATSRRIMEGDFGRRLPVRGSGDELDRLTESLNAMLDQIEHLMVGMREVADNIAHDLRTPLNRLRSRIEVTLMEGGSTETYRGALQETIEDAERIIHTFNAILSIARLESGAHAEAMGEVDLSLLIADVADLYEPLAEEKSIEIAVTAEDGVLAYGNAGLISQALGNLVDNAIKYTPEGGNVHVAGVIEAADAGQRHALLRVTDSGPGIPEDERIHVFDRFVRLESGRHSAGAGLGLSMVRAVARIHRADVELADADPGLVITMRFRTAGPVTGSGTDPLPDRADGADGR